MIARTLCFSTAGKLSLRYEQLVWTNAAGAERTVPIEDVGFVILESEQIQITVALLRFLSEKNVAVVVCDSSHTPSAQLLSYAAHTTAAEHMEAQLNASEALCGRLWRQVCRQKIINQQSLVERLGFDVNPRFQELIEAVKNGDPSNCEGQAARLYFQTIASRDFVRDRYGDWPNGPLNYGYAVLRAAVARAIVGSGLACFCGIHHHNRYNAFALADDVMEPYRPFVDQIVFSQEPPFDRPQLELTKEMKARLLQVLTCDVNLGDLTRPLMVALSYTTASFVRAFKRESAELVLPELP